MVNNLRNYPNTELTWKQLAFLQRAYELRPGDEMLASVRWEDIFSSQATAETAEGRWLFQREGFWKKQVVAYQLGALGAREETPFATIQRNMGGQGTLVLANGREFMWKNTNIWRGEWSWLTNDSTPPLVSFRHKQMEIMPQASSLTELPLLVTFGFYLVILRQSEQVASAS